MRIPKQHRVIEAADDESRPNFFTFDGGELEIQAAAGDGKSVPTFRMDAYNGGVMNLLGFFNPVVVDLAGVEIEGQQLPVRLDHEATRGVGHTTKVDILKSKIKVEGLISRSTSWARDVAESGRNGFPWKASIGAKPHKVNYLPPGRRATINGKSFTGPLDIVTSCTLKEVSFVDSGADPTTSVSVAAMAAEESQMKTFETWLKAKNLDIATLSEEEKGRLKAQFDEEQNVGRPAPSVPAASPAQPAQSEPPQTQTQSMPAPASVQASDTGHVPQSVTAAASEFVAETRRQAAAEMRRQQEIAKLCENGKYGEIQAKAIEEGWDTIRCENEVNKLKVEELRASRPSAPAIHGNSFDAGPEVFEATALMASAVPTNRLEALYQAPTLEAAHRLRGVGIQEFCELACGMQLPRFRRDPEGWLRAAFSTTTLSGILSNVANKMLLEGYNYAEDTWRRICRIASVNDFKQHTRYRMTGSFEFQKVGPDGELKHGSVSEQTFTQQADTYGIMFGITRQMIINDDMGAFTDIPRQIGMGAGEAICDVVWTLLLSNPSSFFSSGHANYLEGADTAFGIDALTVAEVLFAEQTKPNGRPLGIPPSLLLVPIALKGLAQRIYTSQQVNETTTANKPKPVDNPHVGKFEPISSAYLSNSSFTGYSSAAWYLFADPNRLPAIEVAFLNGEERPTVQQVDAEFNMLGVLFRGFIDFGVKEQDYRGAIKMKGAA